MAVVNEVYRPHRASRFAKYANATFKIEEIIPLANYDYEEVYEVTKKALQDLLDKGPHLNAIVELKYSDGKTFMVHEDLVRSINNNLETYINGFEHKKEKEFKNSKVPIYNITTQKLYDFIGYEMRTEEYTFKAYGEINYKTVSKNELDYFRQLLIDDVVLFGDYGDTTYKMELKVKEVHGFEVVYTNNPIHRIRNGYEIWDDPKTKKERKEKIYESILK